MILNSIKSGIIQVFATKRMIFVFFLASFCFGLVIMLPFRAILSDFVGPSMMGAKLGWLLDGDFLFDFFQNKSSAISAVQGLILVVPAFYWLFNLFLSGGAFAVFFSGEKYQPALFWSGCAKYFGRFIRLVLWGVPIFAILFCLQFLASAVEKIIFGSDPYQNISYWFNWIKVGLRFVSFLLFWMVIDYARIYTVINDERKMRRSIWQGVRFTFGHFLTTFSLSLLLFLSGAIILFVYNPLADMLSVSSSIVVLLLFLLQQLYMIFRMMLRLTLYSSQIFLFNSLAGATDSPAEISGHHLSAESLTVI